MLVNVVFMVLGAPVGKPSPTGPPMVEALPITLVVFIAGICKADSAGGTKGLMLCGLMPEPQKVLVGEVNWSGPDWVEFVLATDMFAGLESFVIGMGWTERPFNYILFYNNYIY